MFFDSEYSNDDSSWISFNIALLLVGLSAVIYLIKHAESQNQLDFDSRPARVISGFFRMTANNWHTMRNDIEISDTTGKIFAIGPHRTGLVDASVVISKMKGTPPSFLATDAYNNIPGVASFISLAKAIPVKSDKNSSNSDVLEKAGKVLAGNGCIAIFPQGNFSRIGQEPPRVYEGAARIALSSMAPIHVIRLDGYWCIENRLLPVFIRNNSYYRALFSAFHMNNIRVTQCDVIDFHLKPDCDISDDKKIINEICARLYAYFRHSNDLTAGQIGVIKNEISDKIHLTIWHSKVRQSTLEKELSNEKKEEARLGEPTSLAMKIS